MKNIAKTVTLIFLSLFVLTACATVVDPNYDAYVRSIQGATDYEHKPMVEITIDPETGKTTGIKVWKDRPPVHIEQKRHSPGWALANTLVKVGGWLGGAAIIGNYLTDFSDTLVNAGGSGGTTIGSYNSVGQDYTGNMDISRSLNDSTFGSVSGDPGFGDLDASDNSFLKTDKRQWFLVE